MNTNGKSTVAKSHINESYFNPTENLIDKLHFLEQFQDQLSLKKLQALDRDINTALGDCAGDRGSTEIIIDGVHGNKPSDRFINLLKIGYSEAALVYLKRVFSDFDFDVTKLKHKQMLQAAMQYGFEGEIRAFFEFFWKKEFGTSVSDENHLVNTGLWHDHVMEALSKNIEPDSIKALGDYVGTLSVGSEDSLCLQFIYRNNENQILATSDFGVTSDKLTRAIEDTFMGGGWISAKSLIHLQTLGANIGTVKDAYVITAVKNCALIEEVDALAKLSELSDYHIVHSVLAGISEAGFKGINQNMLSDISGYLKPKVEELAQASMTPDKVKAFKDISGSLIEKISEDDDRSQLALSFLIGLGLPMKYIEEVSPRSYRTALKVNFRKSAKELIVNIGPEGEFIMPVLVGLILSDKKETPMDLMSQVEEWKKPYILECMVE